MLNACTTSLREGSVKVLDLRLYIEENIKAVQLLANNGALNKGLDGGFK